MSRSFCKHGIVKTDCGDCTTEALRRRCEPSGSSPLGWLEDNCCDLRCEDDYHWEVVEHYMAAPHERTIGYGSNPLEAIKNAMNTKRSLRR